MKMLAGALAIAGLLTTAGFWMQTVSAQNDQSWPAIKVAVINVDEVFKKYARFTNFRNEFKKQMSIKEEQIKQLTVDFNAKKKALEEIKGPADRERMLKEMNDIQFQIKAEQQKAEAELLKTESDMYNACYSDMTNMLEKYCSKMGIHMVIRTIPNPDPSRPETVARNYQKDVVYHHPNLDLTEVIVEAMNAQAGQMATPKEKNVR